MFGADTQEFPAISPRQTPFLAAISGPTPEIGRARRFRAANQSQLVYIDLNNKNSGGTLSHEGYD